MELKRSSNSLELLIERISDDWNELEESANNKTIDLKFYSRPSRWIWLHAPVQNYAEDKAEIPTWLTDL